MIDKYKLEKSIHNCKTEKELLKKLTDVNSKEKWRSIMEKSNSSMWGSNSNINNSRTKSKRIIS